MSDIEINRQAIASAIKEIKTKLPMFTSNRDNALFLTEALSDCRSTLDIGCGKNSVIRFMTFLSKTGIDAYQKDLEIARTNKTHDKFIHADAKNFNDKLAGSKFDCTIALDLIEHLPKEDGLALIKNMEACSLKKIIIYTPNGFLAQPSLEPGDFQEHVSGWSVDEMRALGFEVYGAIGPRFLRGTFHQLKIRPIIFWGVVSSILQQIWCLRHPKSAAAIWCVKYL
jgi:SAM-dependent methyltransferase